MTPGRSGPLHYRYRPADFAVAPATTCDTLYGVGGLYGNALSQVLALFAQERGDKRLVFNGDFNWFNPAQALATAQDHNPDDGNTRLPAKAECRGQSAPTSASCTAAAPNP